VTVSEPHGNAVTVNYSTADGTASAGSDYRAVSGKLTFALGEMSKSILVPVIGDRVPEADKTFSLSCPMPRAPRSPRAKASSRSWMTSRALGINDVSLLEGTRARRSSLHRQPVSALRLAGERELHHHGRLRHRRKRLHCRLGDVDFRARPDEPDDHGRVTGDRLPGPDKTFVVNLSTPNSYAAISKGAGVGTIIDDEPRISIADAYNYGESSFTFIVSLSAAYDKP